jgi:hypothetical protein
LKDGSLRLPKRAICFVPEEGNSECVVRIVTNDVMLFEGKLKRPEAKTLGVSRDAGGIYFIDRIPSRTA